MRLLREEVWKTGATSKLNRVAVRSVPGLTHPMVYVWSRLLIVGGDHLRLHEELTFSGGEMKPDGFRRESVLRNLEKLMDSSHPYDDIPEHAFGILKRYFDKYLDSITKTYEARSKERRDALLATLGHRKDSEIRDVNQILDELERMIRKELGIEDDKPRYVQMTLNFSDLEKEELKRDLSALRARLEQIPSEREKEVASIEKHYSDAKALTFPVAVVFLVPENVSWGCRT